MPDPRERFLVRYAGGFAPLVVARAEGAWLETADGRRILDFTSGQICSTIGHNHARIAAAIRHSLDTVVHLNSWMLSEPVLALAERLAGLFPASLDKVMLLNTGSEANEVALKLAKLHTGHVDERWEDVAPPATAHDSRGAARRGCAFADRCPFVMDQCRTLAPPLYRLDVQRAAACFLHQQSQPMRPEELSQVLASQR